MTFGGIQNYYEQLVLKMLTDMGIDSENEDFLEDVACIALNQLPARYVRHNVDMIFYMTADEHKKMYADVEHAIKTAIEYVGKHDDLDKRPNTINQ
jgi:hypothetical protein